MAGTSSRTEQLELSLDFSNTVDWRNGKVPEDSIKTFGSLVSWGVKKRIISEDESHRLLHRAKEGKLEDGAFRRAILLRETIYRIFSAVAHDDHPDEDDVKALNRSLADYPVRSSIVRTGDDYVWINEADNGPEGKLLWPIAKSAADLLASDQLGRVTECANEEEGCGWVFLDKTRSGTKKWCSSTGCGNRAKVRAWYERHEKVRGVLRPLDVRD